MASPNFGASGEAVTPVFAGYAYGQVLGSATVFLAMLVVLVVRPRGLFGIGARA